MVERITKGHSYTEIKWLPVNSLSVVWVGAQRPLLSQHAQKIADNFDPEMFGTLSVTKPNSKGIYHIIDGQHRKVAVEMLWGKNELVPCHVYDAVEPARAAELFDNLNTARRAPKPMDLFKVRVTAKEEVQVAIDNIIKQVGYKLGRSGENGISCVGALEHVYHSYGPVVLEAALRMIKATWGDDSTAASSSIVKGYGMFLSEFRHIDHKLLVTVMSNRFTPGQFTAAARAQRDVGGNIVTNMRDIMMRTYNAKSRKNKLSLNKKDH